VDAACVQERGKKMVEQAFGQLPVLLSANILVGGLCLGLSTGKGARIPFGCSLEEFIARVGALIASRRVSLSAENLKLLLSLAKEQQTRAQQKRLAIAKKIKDGRLLIANKEQERYGLLRSLGVTRGRDRIMEIPAAIKAIERVLTIQSRALSKNEAELIKLGLQLKKLEEICRLLGREVEDDREDSEQLVR